MGTMSEAEGNAPAPVAVITPGDPITIESAVRDVLKTAQYCDGLSRGLNEAVRALEKRDALVCILSESCDEANYVRLIEALSVEHQIPLLKIGDNKLLGEWAGLSNMIARETQERLLDVRALLSDRLKKLRQRGSSSSLICKVTKEQTPVDSSSSAESTSIYTSRLEL